HNHAARVDDLERLRQEAAVGNAVGQAVENRIEDTRLTVAAQALGALSRQRPLIRRKVRQDVAEVFRVERLAEAEPAAGGARLAPADRTQVAYALEGEGARLSHTSAGQTQDHALPRRAGVYLEPGEEASITAGTPLTLLVVSVPKHTGKPNDVASPRGYVFEE